MDLAYLWAYLSGALTGVLIAYIGDSRVSQTLTLQPRAAPHICAIPDSVMLL